MIDAVDCGLVHGRYRMGDGFYVATEHPNDPQVKRYVAQLESRGLHAFRWGDILPSLGNRTEPQPSSVEAPVDPSCTKALYEGVDPSLWEQLLCARAPGRYLAHFVSSWDELVLLLRASRQRDEAISSVEGRGELALLESKLRVALDGGRPETLERTELEGRCKRCHSFRPSATLLT